MAIIADVYLNGVQIASIIAPAIFLNRRDVLIEFLNEYSESEKMPSYSCIPHMMYFISMFYRSISIGI